MGDKNLQNCLDGIGNCDRARLNDDQRQLVAQAAHIRNLQSCLEEGAVAECDQTRLTAWEKEAVAVASHDHNLQNCLEALGTCEQSQLNDQERQAVARAELLVRVRRLRSAATR